MEIAEAIVVLNEIDSILDRLTAANGYKLHTLVSKYSKLYNRVAEEFVPNHPNFTCDMEYFVLSEANRLLLRGFYYKPRIKERRYAY